MAQISMNQEDESKSDPTQVNVSSHKQAARLCFYICLSTVYFGYSLTIIGASNLPLLFKYYHVVLSTEVALALLNGSLPLGGMIGCLLFSKLRTLTTKKKLHYLLTFCTVGVCSFSIIPSLGVLVTCRFFLGILSAQYMALGLNLIKDHFPDRLWKSYGALYSATRILGILICYVFGQLFNKVTSNAGNIFLFLGPLFISVIQAICIGCYLPESPVELIRAKQCDKAKEALLVLYDQSKISQRFQQLNIKINRSVPNKYDTVINPLNICGMHLALLRQFCGVTYLVVYASQIPIHQQTSLGSEAIVVENMLQMVGGLVGILLVNCIPRFYLITFSTFVALLMNIVLAVGSILEEPVMSFSTICVFMFLEGSSLTSVAWSYPSELCTPSIERYASFTSMAGTTLVTILPPFIVANVEEHEGYPIFFFFAVYLILACILNYNLLPRDQQEQKLLIELELSV